MLPWLWLCLASLWQLGAVASGLSATDMYSPDMFNSLGAETDTTAVSGNQECEVAEIQLASDGTIAQWSLELGSRVAPNMTVNGTVAPEEYRFFHLCVARHEHEHLVTVHLHCDVQDLRAGGEASLYLSSEHKYPQLGHATWIAQHPGDDLVKLYTYLDGFPRRHEAAASRWLALHIGVRGVGDVATAFELSVAVDDLAITPEILEREQYYTQRHLQDRRMLRGAA